jgi:hypothetical protein
MTPRARIVAYVLFGERLAADAFSVTVKDKCSDNVRGEGSVGNGEWSGRLRRDGQWEGKEWS